MREEAFRGVRLCYNPHRQHSVTTDVLAACPDRRHIVLTTAGVAPPACPAEKFRRIGQWLREAA